MLRRRPEAKIQAEIVRALGLLGFLVIHIPNQATRGERKYSGMISGAPDLIVLAKNRIWFFEVKSENGKQSQKQVIVQRMIEERGFNYCVVRSVEDAIKAVGYGAQ